MNTLWIQNGRVIDPAAGRDGTGDVFVRDGRFVPSLPAAEKREATVIDATGLVVCPGLVDIHVHFREPGQTHKETIRTGTEAAAAGGFTTVVCMPNTSPPADSAGTIQFIQDAIARDALVHVYPTGAITVGLKGEVLAPIGSLQRTGVVAITDDGHCVQNNALMRHAVEYARMFDLPVLDHCQDACLSEGGVMHEGVVSTRLGLRGWPSAAEEVIVSRNIILARLTGHAIHLQHISSRLSVEMIREAKRRGIPVTAEVSPHHLHLTDELLAGYDTVFKVNPPLRTEEDRQALIAAACEGVFDCIATDHAPHTNWEKDVEFDHAPFGLVGLETALPVVLEVLHAGRGLPLPALLALLTHRPAALLKLPAGTLAEGAPADVAVFDPGERWRVEPSTLHSKSFNSPWLGRELTGRVRTTIAGGRVVWDGRLFHRT